MAEPRSLQERYSPEGRCFGCGPANKKGLRIRSLEEGDALVADWTPEPHHAAFDSILNGGIIGSLLDCHSNWAAAWALMRRDHAETPPCTVTAEFSVRLKRPTPMQGPVRLRAVPVEIDGPRVKVEATLEAGGRVTATCTGIFVAVGEDHPAFHRW